MLTWPDRLQVSQGLCEGTDLCPHLFLQTTQETITQDILQHVWQELDYHLNVCHVKFIYIWISHIDFNKLILDFSTLNLFSFICRDIVLIQIFASQMIVAISKWNDINFSETAFNTQRYWVRSSVVATLVQICSLHFLINNMHVRLGFFVLWHINLHGLFNVLWHINLHGLFNAKPGLVEGQLWYYLVHSRVG